MRDAHALTRPVLTWLHFGDLHVTGEEQANYRDFRALIAQAHEHLADGVDFAILPGDNANDGTEAQFGLVRRALDGLRILVHVLAGDHDFTPRSLERFHAILGADRLPKALTVSGHRCLFLDVVSAGTGGPDFRLGSTQLAWLEQALAAADAAAERSAVFMHVYPADLVGDEARTVAALFHRHRVAVVDMGHTHYNEIANDGRTIFLATRSIGQVEEGPVGFSVAAIDRGVVSWRFKRLASPWPLTLITAPADRRLVTEPGSSEQVAGDAIEVRACGWSAHGIVGARCRVDDGPWRSMSADPGAPRWHLGLPMPARDFRLTVHMEDAAGNSDSDVIEVATDRREAPPRHADGSDRDRIGAWPEKDIPGGQLGPNRNGRQW